MKKYLLLIALFAFVGSVFAQEDTEPLTLREAAPDPNGIDLVPLVTGLTRPLYVTHAPDDAERLFLLQQGGIINIYDMDGNFVSEFLNLSSLVTPAANSQRYTEQGLLGLAFHPDYAENGAFFINYTDVNGNTVISRFRVTDDPNVADISSEEVLFTQRQPFPNHNGGHMEFGPDGYLYISLGDGGSANDPLGAGQDTNLVLGSILRIDVNSAEGGYAIPEDNPFADGGGAPEIWAYGLRNVWRFSFDSATGDMYLGDVGQNQIEEVNFQPADSAGGINYGWNAFEGNNRFDTSVSADNSVMPFATYMHSGAESGCSVTGGYVYRGEAVPDMQGVYVYGDYCTGNIWAAYRDLNGEWQSDFFRSSGLQISSFGEDANGELYVVHYGGELYKMVAVE